MGAWGHRNFENDGALDFIWKVEEQGVSAIVKAIDTVATFDENEYLDSSECEELQAAVEFIAAAKGNPSEDFPENAEDWLANYKGSELTNADLVEKSNQALDRLLRASEMKELWEEAGSYDTWAATINDLKKRITNI